MAKLKVIKVNLKLPYIGGIEGEWEPDENERKAAWEMYVEVITRISMVELKPEEGLLREALSSYHSLFGITRTILRSYGPTIAKPKGKNCLSFGYVAIAILNAVLRPTLAKWHPLLVNYENTKSSNVSLFEHERAWEKSGELRKELNQVREKLTEYSHILADIAQIVPLDFKNTRITSKNS